MRETLIVIGLLVLALALRSAGCSYLRKLGAATFLLASYLLVYFLTGRPAVSSIGVICWFFLPWVELISRIRKLRLPIQNRLDNQLSPNPEFFPNAPEAEDAILEAGFEHVSDCGWEWDAMHQYFRIYWNPEERAVATICLCEQSDVAFAFISISSQHPNGSLWRTTNFPFAPTLQSPASVRWNHVPCSRNCFHDILKDHQTYLTRQKVASDDLQIPDPDLLVSQIEQEMKNQIDHNLQAGIITLTPDSRHFRYSKRGLCFLWWQFLKDMVRFC